jgi:hypothetical protein
MHTANTAARRLSEPEQHRVTTGSNEVENHIGFTFFIHEKPIAGAADVAFAKAFQIALQLMVVPRGRERDITCELIDAPVEQIHVTALFHGNLTSPFIIRGRKNSV